MAVETLCSRTERRENKRRRGKRGGERQKGKVSRVPEVNLRLSTSWYTYHASVRQDGCKGSDRGQQEPVGERPTEE